MRHPVGYGVDFGTSNSSAAVAFADGSVELVPVAAGLMPHSLQSITYLHRNGNRLAGEEGVNEFLVTGSHRTRCEDCPLVVNDLWGKYSDCRHYAGGGRCNNARLMHGLKSLLSNEVFKVTHSWALDFEMADLVAVILKDLARRAEALYGEIPSRVALGYPVAFVGTEGNNFEALQELAEQRIHDAASAAGFSEIELIPEPAAAVIGQPLAPGYSVALDFGGGTFDVAVVKVLDSSGEGEVVALQGAAVGGNEFDGLLFDLCIAPQIPGFGDLPFSYRSELRTLTGIRALLSDPEFERALARLRSQGGAADMLFQIVFGGHAYAFYKAIEMAKLKLSSAMTAEISFERPGISINASVSRRDFEELIANHMFAVEKAIDNALDEAGIGANDIHTVVRTGGSSDIPMFLGMVQRKFPSATVRPLPIYTAVVEGLGRIAAERWTA